MIETSRGTVEAKTSFGRRVSTNTRWKQRSKAAPVATPLPLKRMPVLTAMIM